MSIGDEPVSGTAGIEALYRRAREWKPAERAAMLAWAEQTAARKRIVGRYANAAEIAAACDPNYRITPAIKMIANAVETVLDEPSRNLLVTMSPQEGKEVADYELVPTCDGWKKHGDLANTDWVFHPSGRMIRVLQVHPPGPSDDRRVHFSDHTHLDVHRFHEWTVWDRSIGGFRTIDTARLELVRLSHGTPGRRGHGYRFHLPLREAVELPDANLPIEPYTLGVWLGDGSSTKAAVTHHPDDEYELAYPHSARCVHPTTGAVTDYYRGGLLRALKSLGVFADKHIPRTYLRSSVTQRRALLAGLIDTDGCIYGTQVSFDNANEGLVRDTAELIRSLGYRAHVHVPTPAKTSSSGVVGRQDMWRVTFSPHDVAPARLERKIAKWKPAQRKRIAIIGIEKITPAQGRCITVDSGDGLYLVGEGWTPTHNSSLCAVWAPIRAWQKNPDARVILACYNDDLAHKHSLHCRDMIRRYGTGVVDSLTGAQVEDRLGLRLSSKSKRLDNWYIDGGDGSMLAVGLGSGATGHSCDLLVIDDPYKNVQEADSAAHRAKVEAWMSQVALTRQPKSIVLIQTRWHPEDLAGKTLAAELRLSPQHRSWRYINIPAISEKGIYDSLGREPGVVMESARSRTKEAFEATRRKVGERTWYAMFQGSPRNPAGGLFERAWFHPVQEPVTVNAVVVGVDPADSGIRDHTGIIGAVLGADGKIVLTRDESGLYTSDQWAKIAVRLALELGAREITLEGFNTWDTYKNTVRSAYRDIHVKAAEKLATGATLDPVETKCLSPSLPFLIGKYTERGDSEARAALMRQQFEIGAAQVTDELDEFVTHACDWQSGQHCPDRVSAAVIAHNRLYRLGSGQMALIDPSDEEPVDSPWSAWLSQKVTGDLPGRPARMF